MSVTHTTLSLLCHNTNHHRLTAWSFFFAALANSERSRLENTKDDMSDRQHRERVGEQRHGRVERYTERGAKGEKVGRILGFGRGGAATGGEI